MEHEVILVVVHFHVHFQSIRWVFIQPQSPHPHHFQQFQHRSYPLDLRSLNPVLNFHYSRAGYVLLILGRTKTSTQLGLVLVNRRYDSHHLIFSC